jgi:cell wall-associated NlpC family hydrolase
MMTEREVCERAAVVDEARTWLNTPYVTNQGCKGAGVDCAWILLRVYTACGLIQVSDPIPYKAGLARLRSGEHFYRGMIERFAVLVIREARPGDIVLFRVPVASGSGVITARATHGAIVESWPTIIHAYSPAGAVVRSDLSTDGVLAGMADSLWTLRAWATPVGV